MTQAPRTQAPLPRLEKARRAALVLRLTSLVMAAGSLLLVGAAAFAALAAALALTVNAVLLSLIEFSESRRNSLFLAAAITALGAVAGGVFLWIFWSRDTPRLLLWGPPALVIAICAGGSLYLARGFGALRGACKGCGYRMSDTTTGVCPECGEPYRDIPG